MKLRVRLRNRLPFPIRYHLAMRRGRMDEMKEYEQEKRWRAYAREAGRK